MFADLFKNVDINKMIEETRKKSKDADIKITEVREIKSKVDEHSNPDLQKILDKIHKVRSYIPKVGVFGNSGVGKSSLCNALFGKNVAKISDVEACTRKPQSIFLGGVDGGIELIDLPGIGEDPARQAEYVGLYESLTPELDLVLWAIKADDRNYASGIEAYQKIFSNRIGLPVVFVITQADKTNPVRGWICEEFLPGEKQLSNILIKEHDVSKRFGVSTKNIISVAVGEENPSEKYNIVELVDLIVEVLPNEKKYSFAREAKSDNVSEESRERAERGIWDYVKDFAGDAWDSVKDVVVDTIVESAGKLAKAAATKLVKLLKFW